MFSNAREGPLREKIIVSWRKMSGWVKENKALQEKKNSFLEKNEPLGHGKYFPWLGNAL